MSFWDRLMGREPLEGDETVLTDDDNTPPVDGDEGQQDDQQQDDPLAELDDETRELLEAHAKRQVDAERARQREALRTRGLDLSDDGPVIADPQKVTTWLGVPQSRQEPAPQQPQSPAPQAQADEPEAPPDPSYDPAGFAAWLHKRDEAQRDALLKPVMDQLDQLRARQTQTEARGVTVQQVAAALQVHNPALAAVVDHPDFEPTYKTLLMQTDASQWQNPQVLAGLAGMAAAYLDPARQPQRAQPRDNQGRFLESAGDRAAAQRAGRVQLTPSSDMGAGPTQRRYTEEDRTMAQMVGVSMAEWDALDDPTGQAYLKARERRKTPKPEPTPRWRP